MGAASLLQRALLFALAVAGTRAHSSGYNKAVKGRPVTFEQQADNHLDQLLEVFARIVEKIEAKEIDSKQLRDDVDSLKEIVPKEKDMVKRTLDLATTSERLVKRKRLYDEYVFAETLLFHCISRISDPAGENSRIHGDDSCADVKSAVQLLRQALKMDNQRSGEYKDLLSRLKVGEFVAESAPKEGYQSMSETEIQPMLLGKNTALLMTFDQIAEQALKVTGYFAARSPQNPSLLYICHTRKANRAEKRIKELAQELMKVTVVFEGEFTKSELIASQEKDGVLVLVVDNAREGSEKEILSVIKKAIDQAAKRTFGEQVEEKLDVALKQFAMMVKTGSSNLSSVREAVSSAEQDLQVVDWANTGQGDDEKFDQLTDDCQFQKALLAHYCTSHTSAGNKVVGSPTEVERAMRLLKNAGNLDSTRAGDYKRILSELEVGKYVVDSTPEKGYQLMIYEPMIMETESQPIGWWESLIGGKSKALTFGQIAEKAGKETGYFSLRPAQNPTLLYICHTREANSAEEDLVELAKLADELLKMKGLFEGKHSNSGFFASYVKDAVLVLVVKNARPGSENEILGVITKAIDKAAKNKGAGPNQHLEDVL